MVTVRIIITSILLLNQDFLYFCQKAHQPQDCYSLICVCICVPLFFVFLLKVSVLTAPQDCLLLNQSDFTDKKGLRQQTQRPQKHLFFLDLYIIFCLYFAFSYLQLYLSKFIFLFAEEKYCGNIQMLQKYHFQIGMQHRQQKGHCVRDLNTQVILFPSPTPPLSSGKI